MRQIIKLMSLGILVSLLSCDNQEIETSLPVEANAPEAGISPSDLNEAIDHNCATNSQFGANSYWSNTVVNQTYSDFILAQHNNAAATFGLPNVPLYFAAGSGTYNAFSYGSPNYYVIWGEEFAQAAGNYGWAALSYIVAHEIGHQVQYRNGFPSVTGASNSELEADGFAGYYIRKGYDSNWNNLIPAYNFANSIGSGNGASHGSGAQRRSAVRLGWWLAGYNLSNSNIDYYFFYYYNSIVIPGNWSAKSKEIMKPKGMAPEMHAFMVSKLDELRKINTGEISKEQFAKLSSN